MAGRKKELTNPHRMSIIIEKADRDKLIKIYGHYGISKAIRSVLPLLLECEPEEEPETVEFGSVV